LVSIVPEISSGEPALVHEAAVTVFGDTLTLTFVTSGSGASTTGMPVRLPAVLVTLAATQHRRLELRGSTICHQPLSFDRPMIWALVPTPRPLRTTQPVPGPSRQLTATSLGKATGTLGVEVEVGGGVSDGRLVGAGGWVAMERVGVALSAKVGVSVTCALVGRLQADRAKTRMNNRRRDRIGLLL
jgi:hypothetical protein